MKEPITKEDFWLFAAEIIREVRKMSLPTADQTVNIGYIARNITKHQGYRKNTI